MSESDRQHDLQPTDTHSTTILLFHLVDQLYGIPIADIVQIVEMVAITPLAQVPSFITGVINYHGTLVPLVDLRLRFNLPFLPYRLHTPILLTSYHDQILGIVVDSMDEVQDVTVNQFHPYQSLIPAQLNEIADHAIPHVYWIGLIEHQDQIVPIVKPTQLLTAVEQTALQDALTADDAHDGNNQ